MNFDAFMTGLPFLGPFLEKTYIFWRANVALANVTHIVFGFGLAVFFLTRRRKLGMALILAALGMHLVAYLN